MARKAKNNLPEVIATDHGYIIDESTVREGCMCGHGQYEHHGLWTGPTLGCFVRGCACKKFRRDRRGDVPADVWRERES